MSAEQINIHIDSWSEAAAPLFGLGGPGAGLGPDPSSIDGIGGTENAGPDGS